MTLRVRIACFLFPLAMAVAADDAAAQAPSPSPAASAPPLRVVVLGSGGPGATGRAGSGYLVLVDGTPRILVDAGPGTFARLGEARLSMARVDTVLLTHLHVDHAGELPGLFKARAVSTGGPIRFDVFGPGAGKGKGTGHKGNADDAAFPSTQRFIDLLFGRQGAFGYLRDFSAPMAIHATNVGSSKGIVRLRDQDGLSITAIAGHHRDAPAVVYRIDHAGHSVTFSGDIDPQGHEALRRIARGTGLLVFNSVVLDPPGSAPVLYSLHTAPKAIGEIAAQAGAGKLLLSHLSPSVEREREAVRSSIGEAYRGETVFAEDGLTVDP